jgi:hypothetical protein
MENQTIYPTEEVTLPSKGLVYPLDNPLSKGIVEMKYMTAKEEDILTNESYIKKGIVVDKLLKSLIVSPINYDDLIMGDKNAILIAARVLGYGKEYTFKYPNSREEDEYHTIDLTEVKDKELDEKYLLEKYKNEFSFTLPVLKKEIVFKLLTHGDEKKIEAEINGLKKVNKENSPELTTRLKYVIQSVDGDTDKKTIREFIDTKLLARDARAFREYLKEIQPDVNLVFDLEDSYGEIQRGVRVPIGITFLWPDFDR